MTSQQLFEVMLSHPILTEKYELKEDQLIKMNLYTDSNSDIVDLIKIILNGIENETPKGTINSQIRTHFKL